MNRRQKLVQQQFLNNEKGVIKRLDQVYGQALKDVNGNIERLMKRFDPETGDLPQSAVYQLKYQNMIKDQLEGILNELQTKQFTSVSEYLDTCYEDGFIGSIFDLHGQDVPLMMPLDQESMVTVVQLDSKISQGLYTRLGEDIALLKKRITAEVSRSIATGASFADTAKHLAGKTRIGYNNAIRIARTEGHRIQNQATMNVMEQAKERGADVVKQWDATLDGATRESHVAVDGEIRELDQAFSNGIQFPGDPSGRAEEVINCRCALLQRARWAVGDGFTKWNNFTRQLETFESPQQYDEFKKAFFAPENKRYMNYVQQMEKKYGTRDFEKVLDRMSEREYKHYSRLLAGNPVYNTKAPDAVDPIATLLPKTKPVRPRSADYDDYDDFLTAREQYREAKRAYDAQIQKWADAQMPSAPMDRGQLADWCEKHGIVIGDIDGIDMRTFHTVTTRLEALRKDYPLSEKLYYSTGEVLTRTYEFEFVSDTDFFIEASRGMRFGRVFRDYEEVLLQYGEQIASGFNVRGSGTINTLIDHEYGHAVMYSILRGEQMPLETQRQMRVDLVESCVGKAGISEYAMTNEDELFAEGFAAYYGGEQTEFAKAFGDFLGRWLK
jgi:hypothetical protein